MSENTAQDVAISDFRQQHSEALNTASHPLHGQRLTELSALYDQKFAAPAAVTAPAVSATEFRQQHDAVLMDKTHADHAVRVDQLSRITERDTAEPGDAIGVGMAAATSVTAYDDAFAKAKQAIPYGSELMPDAAFEAETRQAFFDNGASPFEAMTLLDRYMAAQRTDFMPETPETCAASIRQQFGGKADDVIHAVRKLVTAAPDRIVARIEEAGLANDFFTFSALAKIAKRKGLWS